MTTTVLGECEKRGHEQVSFFYYPEVGLKAIVAIHDTTLGPAIGGCRMRLYESEAQAIDDVMRLSEGMTYKNSVAGLNIGGGKACLIADPKLKEGREALFKKFGECLNGLSGRYLTAEDMGTSVADMMGVRSATKFVVGTDPDKGGAGDPSPWTAQGVFLAIQAAVERITGSRDLTGKRVSLQGVGHVGMHILKKLRDHGAEVVVCDTHDSSVQEAISKYGATGVTPDGIYEVPCDVYAPCAVGQTINPTTLQRLDCKIIAGAANNQISDPSVYPLIQKRNILYCPDFVINSGGIICVAGEIAPEGWNRQWVTEKVEGIFATTCKVLEESEKRGKFPEEVAIELAKERIAAARRAKQG